MYLAPSSSLFKVSPRDGAWTVESARASCEKVAALEKQHGSLIGQKNVAFTRHTVKLSFPAVEIGESLFVDVDLRVVSNRTHLGIGALKIKSDVVVCAMSSSGSQKMVLGATRFGASHDALSCLNALCEEMRRRAPGEKISLYVCGGRVTTHPEPDELRVVEKTLDAVCTLGMSVAGGAIGTSLRDRNELKPEISRHAPPRSVSLVFKAGGITMRSDTHSANEMFPRLEEPRGKTLRSSTPLKRKQPTGGFAEKQAVVKRRPIEAWPAHSGVTFTNAPSAPVHPHLPDPSQQAPQQQLPGSPLAAVELIDPVESVEPVESVDIEEILATMDDAYADLPRP